MGSTTFLARVRALITDSVFPRLALSQRSISVNEGEIATYAIVPASEPSRSFTITPMSTDTDSVTVSPSSLTFTVGANGNWQTPQTVTVTGVKDNDEFDDVATIRHLSTYSGTEYRLGRGVEVTVADGNRAPFFEEGLKTTRYVPENSGQGTAVGEPVSATDLNNDTLTYKIEVQQGGPYTVDIGTGQIRLGTGVNLNYEVPTVQEVKLTVQDPDGLMDAIEVEILIANVNEPPVVRGNDVLRFRENRTGRIALYTASDPERDSFTWSVGERDGSLFSIDSLGYLAFKEPPDYDNPRRLRLRQRLQLLDPCLRRAALRLPSGDRHSRERERASCSHRHRHVYLPRERYRLRAHFQGCRPGALRHHLVSVRPRRLRLHHQ